MISALFINYCVQSTTCFKPDTVNKTVTRFKGRKEGRCVCVCVCEREREREARERERESRLIGGVVLFVC